MPRNRLAVRIFLLAGTVALALSCEAREPTFEERADGCIASYVDKWDYEPGISVSVLSSAKGIDYNRACGKASVSEKSFDNTVDTPHFLYSITKSFVASSAIKLVIGGELSYDDDIGKYCDNLNPIYVNEDATIGELLSHRSGIQDYADSFSAILGSSFASTGEWDPETILSFLQTPAGNRGEFIYSSANYVLLGMIIEKVTGKRLNQYIRESFLEALDLDLRLYPQDDVDLSLLAHPHAYPNTFMGLVGDGKSPIDITSQIGNVLDLLGKCGWAAGGMVGNAAETAKWGYGLLSENGGIADAIRNEVEGSVRLFAGDAGSEAYGYGVRRIFHDGREFIGSYGRSIGDENLMFYNKDKDVCIVILTSSNMRRDKTPNIDELMYAIYDCI